MRKLATPSSGTAAVIKEDNICKTSYMGGKQTDDCTCDSHGHLLVLTAYSIGLLLLTQDIYIARAEGELALEEELFYLLLKIYKTPELLQQLTQDKLKRD
jgi:hypothetical protein